MKILVSYPSRDELNRIVERTVRPEDVDMSRIMDRSEILDLRAVDLFWPAPLEGIESFEHWKSGLLDPAPDTAVHGRACRQLLRFPG